MKESHIKTINLGRGEEDGNKTFLAPLGHFLMYVNLFSGVALMIKINPFGIYEITMVSVATYNAIQKNGGGGGCLGILMNNLAPMKNCPRLVLYV